MERWQVSAVAVIMLGLAVGWLFDPYIGLALIWVLLILVELLSHGEGHS